jgi:hypothetical protein
MISCVGAGTRARPLVWQQLYGYLDTAHGQLYGTAVAVVDAGDVVDVEHVIDAEDVDYAKKTDQEPVF